MSTAQEINENDVQRLVQAALAKYQPRTFSLHVEAIVRQPDFWQVLVRPDRNGVRADDYADALTSAEELLRDEQHLPVLLVPVLVE